MENNGKERGRYYPASITFMQYISSWEAEGEGKPWAFPVLCFRLTFKTYCFKMLIVMSDISCVTKWIVTAEGETFFLTISLPAKEGWLKMEQRWGGGSDRRAIRANVLQSVHSYAGGDEGLPQNTPASLQMKTLYWITACKQSNGISQPPTHPGSNTQEHYARQYNQSKIRSTVAPNSELPGCSFRATPSTQQESELVSGDATDPFRQFQGN